MVYTLTHEHKQRKKGLPGDEGKEEAENGSGDEGAVGRGEATPRDMPPGSSEEEESSEEEDIEVLLQHANAPIGTGSVKKGSYFSSFSIVST